MNWHLSRLCLAVLFWLLCFALFWWVSFWFLFSACGDFVTAYWTMRRSYSQFTLEAPQSADGHVQHAIERVGRPGGSHEGVGRKKWSTNVAQLQAVYDAAKLHAQHSRGPFFPSNAFMASARSSNTFNCMLQTRVN